MDKVSIDILERAIIKWGNHSQLLMVLEEMSELQKEILKNINRQKDNIDAIIDEVADVELMLEQLKFVYQIDEAVKQRIPVKLEKIKARLED